MESKTWGRWQKFFYNIKKCERTEICWLSLWPEVKKERRAFLLIRYNGDLQKQKKLGKSQ